jgi:hypothetical protein
MLVRAGDQNNSPIPMTLSPSLKGDEHRATKPFALTKLRDSHTGYFAVVVINSEYGTHADQAVRNLAYQHCPILRQIYSSHVIEVASVNIRISRYASRLESIAVQADSLEALDPLGTATQRRRFEGRRAQDVAKVTHGGQL